MQQSYPTPGLPKPLRAYIAVTAVGGATLLAYLVSTADWGTSVVVETAVFALLIVAAGSFPLPVAPRVKADVATAVLFGAVLLLEPGASALAATVGMTTYTCLLRFWGDRLRLPWYKYPFNAGSTALSTGLTAVVFHALAADDQILTAAVVPAAAVKYAINSSLITGAASLQMGMNPLRFWWMGTKDNGPAELSLLAFGFLGALVYRESAWTLIALFIPVSITYIAFSRLGRTNARLVDALARLEALQGKIANNAKLASVGQISLDMAHQIKNPLTIILGRLEGMRTRLPSESPLNRELDAAMNAGWRIKELTDNFTLMARQKAVPIDVCNLLTEAYGMAGLGKLTRPETDWQCEEGLPKVTGNPVLLREAMSNIFSNALEAVGDRGTISIGAERFSGMVIIRVSDNGPGVPSEMVGRLFEPFQSTKVGGSGLGLFATKHILEMHRGGVKLETKDGQGTSVIITLPVRPFDGEPPVGEDGAMAREERSDTPQLAKSR